MEQFFLKEQYILSSESNVYTVDKIIYLPQELAETFNCKEISFKFQDQFFIFQNHTPEIWVFNCAFRTYFMNSFLSPYQKVKIRYKYHIYNHIHFLNQYFHSFTSFDSETHNNDLYDKHQVSSKDLRFTIKSERVLQQENISDKTKISVCIKLIQ